MEEAELNVEMAREQSYLFDYIISHSDGDDHAILQEYQTMRKIVIAEYR
jgi:hypothetical protein